MTDQMTRTERVARAIYEASRPFVLAGNDDVPAWSEGQRQIWQTIATAALTAIDEERDALREALTTLVETCEQDERDGYHSSLRTYVLEIARPALARSLSSVSGEEN